MGLCAICDEPLMGDEPGVVEAFEATGRLLCEICFEGYSQEDAENWGDLADGPPTLAHVPPEGR